MRKIFIKFKENALSSYWFFPATLFLLSFLLAWSTISLDLMFQEDIKEFIQEAFFFLDLSVETARIYLSTIIGAVITVVGVVFSLTILTVSTASRQFGPRVLNNFMRDKGNQLTLGIYTATFVYASTILISLYEKDESFIPYLSVFLCYSMALLCIAFLIYYIHHIPESLRIENIIHQIAMKALKLVERKFPQEEKLENWEILDSPEQMALFKELERNIQQKIVVSSVGYIQAVDVEGLARWAVEKDALVYICAQPGDFCGGQSVIVKTNKNLNPKEIAEVKYFYEFGMGRTLPQNLMYLLSQLMEVAIRSLSKSMNDPITAMSCLDWLEACLLKLIDCDSGHSIIHDKNRQPRILLRPLSLEEVLEHMEKGLRTHVSRDFAVSMHFLKSLRRMSARARSEGQKKAIESIALSLMDSCGRQEHSKRDMERLVEIFRSFSTNKLESTHEH
ncbi:MAG: DUF2254 domain-containing protein [Bacteriovoracaceae bacterium]